MTQTAGLLTHLQRVEEHVQRARQSWNATDIARCEECVGHLQKAAEELLAAKQLAGDGGAPTSDIAVKAKDRLQQLHSSVNRLGRLVDAAIAFHRNLALDTGMEEALSSNING